MTTQLGLIFGLIIGIWMYKDAQKRNVDQPLLWFFVGLLFGLLGFAGYWYWFIYKKENGRSTAPTSTAPRAAATRSTRPRSTKKAKPVAKATTKKPAKAATKTTSKSTVKPKKPKTK